MNPVATEPRKAKTNGQMKAPIPVDGRSYLTDEGHGRFLVWDQRDVPAATPLIQINREMAMAIIRHTKQGKKMLHEIYHRHAVHLSEQGKLIL